MLKKIEKIISNKTGLDVILTSQEKKDYRGKTYTEIYSNNLIAQLSPVCQLMWSSYIIIIKPHIFEHETYISVDCRYEFQTGGSNGATLFNTKLV